MTELLKYHGLELLEFPTDIVALNRDEIELQVREAMLTPPCPANEAPKLYRTARMLPGTPGPLKRILEVAGLEFNEITERMTDRGVPARVANHTFGLFELDSRAQADDASFRGLRYTHPSIPRNYGLAAEVEIIRDSTALSPRHCLSPGAFRRLNVLSSTLRDYRQNSSPRKEMWYDPFIRQYRATRSHVVQLDVEPLLCLRH